MLPQLHIQGKLRVCVPMMVDGNISGEGGIAGCTPGGTAPPLRLSPCRPPGVTQKEGKIYTMKRCAALAMVTQLDKVLGWLCGLLSRSVPPDKERDPRQVRLGPASRPGPQPLGVQLRQRMVHGGIIVEILAKGK